VKARVSFESERVAEQLDVKRLLSRSDESVCRTLGRHLAPCPQMSLGRQGPDVVVHCCRNMFLLNELS
jgi:hypothetical protein